MTQTAAQILDSIKPGAAALLTKATDTATLQRIARNLTAYHAGQITECEAAGMFSVNVEELLEIIERQARGRHVRTV